MTREERNLKNWQKKLLRLVREMPGAAEREPPEWYVEMDFDKNFHSAISASASREAIDDFIHNASDRHYVMRVREVWE